MAGPGTVSALAGLVIALVPSLVFSALAFRYGGGRFCAQMSCDTFYRRSSEMVVGRYPSNHCL